MGSHINTDGKFQSDRYPTCPAGKVPLSVKDPTAQDLLWTYAQRRRSVDAEFSQDLEACLLAAGYVDSSLLDPGAGAFYICCGETPYRVGDKGRWIHRDTQNDACVHCGYKFPPVATHSMAKP